MTFSANFVYKTPPKTTVKTKKKRKHFHAKQEAYNINQTYSFSLALVNTVEQQRLTQSLTDLGNRTSKNGPTDLKAAA